MARKKKLIIGIGDSIMNGCCCDYGNFKNIYGFMQMLQARLSGHGYEFRIFAKNGAASLKVGHGRDIPGGPVLEKRSFWNLDIFQKSLKQRPDAVLFMFGTNDVGWWGRGGEVHFARDWKNLLGKYMTLPNSPRVITMIPPPALSWTCPDAESLQSDPYMIRFCSGVSVPSLCLVTCSLPRIIRQLTQDMGLRAPLDLNALHGGPNHTSVLYQWTTSEASLASPSHPTCAGHERIAKHIVHNIFPEMEQHMKEVLFPMAHATPDHRNVYNGTIPKEQSAGEELQTLLHQMPDEPVRMLPYLGKQSAGSEDVVVDQSIHLSSLPDPPGALLSQVAKQSTEIASVAFTSLCVIVLCLKRRRMKSQV